MIIAGPAGPRHLMCRLRPIYHLGRGLMLTLMAFGLSSILCLFGSPRADAAPDSCLNGLPVPTPKLHKVVQLVNCSNQRVLGTANAAHVAGKPPTPVLPREGTWVMEPVGSPNFANVLTIDIPQEWENTSPEGSVGPNFWARTGCRYDTEAGISQCETGGCSGIYDCSKALLGPPAGVSIAEWTFYQPTTVVGKGQGKGTEKGQGKGKGITQETTYYLDHPDISAVNGVNLNMDIQPVGGSTNNPILPSDPQWLAQNYPLTVHGADLRTPGQGLGQCSPKFQLKRSDLTGFTTPPTPPGQAPYAYVIVDSNGVPQNPPGDAVVACFSNCGRYEFPSVPSANCNDSDPNCYLWKTFCLNAPAAAYGKSCKNDNDCYYQGTNYGISCFFNQGPGAQNGTCSGRGFIKNKTCPANVCTFPYGYQGSFAWQPPYAQCKDVTSDPAACIGDDTVHQVMRKAYTWPNDPQVYGGDAPLYRIIFAPGGTSVPVTPSYGQGRDGSGGSGIPLCSSLPSFYGYASQFSGPGSTACNKPCDGQLNSSCPGFKPPAATFAVAFPGATSTQTWACNFNPSGGGGNNGVICRWQ
jgi:hypothetical protein